MSDETVYEARPATFKANPILSLTVIYYLIKKVQSMHTLVRVSPKGVEYETGVLRRDTASVPAARLSTYRIRQSLFERMFGLCTLEVYGAGDKPEVAVNALPDTKKLKAVLRQFD